MERTEIYREFRFYKKRTNILHEITPSFLKDAALLLVSALVYRNSKRGAARALSLLMGGKAITDTMSRIVFPKPLLIVDEEGIMYTPSIPFFDINVKMAWEEIASIYISEVTSPPPDSSDKPKDGVQTTLFKVLALRSSTQSDGKERFLFIIPKDVEAFKQSRGFQDLETFQHGRNLLDIDLRRVLAHVWLEKTGTPFLLPQGALHTPFEEVLTRIRTQFADKLQSSGIEMLEEQKFSFETEETAP